MRFDDTLRPRAHPATLAIRPSTGDDWGQHGSSNATAPSLMLNLAPIFVALINPPTAPPPVDFSVVTIRPATSFALDALKARLDQRTDEFKRGTVKWVDYVKRMKESIISSRDLVDAESEEYFTKNLTDVRNTIVDTRKSMKRQIKFYIRNARGLRGAEEPIGKLLLDHSGQIRDVQMGMISTMEDMNDFLFLMLQQSREFHSGGISFQTADRISMHIKQYRNKMAPAEARRPSTSIFDSELSSKRIMKRYEIVRAHLGE